MRKAGILIDSWKQEIFENMLKNAQYSYEITDGVKSGTKTITVETNSVGMLYRLIDKANQRAAQEKKANEST